jgi:hypothetical protein
MEIVKKEKLEQLIKAHWSEFMDTRALLGFVLKEAREANYQTIQQIPPTTQVKVVVTKVNIVDLGTLELWAEFSVPVNAGMAIGTHIFYLKIDAHQCQLQLQETFGTCFVPQITSMQ